MDWYGVRYPRLEDLEAAAEQLGCLLADAPLAGEAIYFAGEGPEPPVILLPAGASPLRRAWALAHELGHLVQHLGPKGPLRYGKDERQADRWAACALIPQARIERHGNASEDAFVAALSAHYEDIPPQDCSTRRLAGRIARIRLRALTSSRVIA